MQRSVSHDASKPLQTSKSFTRFESLSDTPGSRTRASTISATPASDILSQSIVDPLHEEEGARQDDAFTSHEDAKSVDGDDGMEYPTFGSTLIEDLPIEIRSMTERFLDSLTAKVHPQPLTIDALSDMYQEFYDRASTQISNHIATLTIKLSREQKATQEQQLLTAAEVADRKKARRLLELKKFALEESIERIVCEKIYDKLWRHRSTDDEERDQKLRSKTAALALVGIGLKELLVTGEGVTEDVKESTAENEEIIKEWLQGAINNIAEMNQERHPYGKMQHLTAAHKNVVETLSRIFPSSSSADEILPTLIYTLIISSPETINVISDLHFIQRFRNHARVDGEMAYCLVNLEAATSFLETVDLSSLRANEPKGGQKSTSRPATPTSQGGPMNLGLAQAPERPGPSPTTSDKTPETTKSQRRLSNLLSVQTAKFEAASDAVREGLKSSADQAIDSINSTLDESFKFLFGRLKEQQKTNNTENIMPKTLEDARKLVSTPPPEEDAVSVGASSTATDDRGRDSSQSRLDNKLSEIFGGKRPIRERSTDSSQSGTSDRRVAFATAKPLPSAPLTVSAATATQPAVASTSTGLAAVDSVRSLGSSLNPLNRFANMNVLPRFGRSTPSNPSTPTTSVVSNPITEKSATSEVAALKEVDAKGMKALAALDELKKTTPPLKKFMEMKDARNVRIGEVDELLKEYQRLAAAMRQALQTGL